MLQCVGDDQMKWQALQNNPRVELINRYFADGGYARQIEATDAMLLPYRRSSYNLRVSRVVIESMIHGLPVMATQGTTLASQAEEYGAAIPCEDGDAASLVTAIHKMEQQFADLKGHAEQQAQKCREHFSVRHFREIIIGQPMG
ncbi:MAG: glycosyltransferase [Limisphaerales bacterium]